MKYLFQGLFILFVNAALFLSAQQEERAIPTRSKSNKKPKDETKNILINF
jgi:hypothetical protein